MSTQYDVPKDLPSNFNSSYKYFGLFEKRVKAPIPLKRIRVNAKISDYVAEITYSQVFYNSSKNKIETEYFFPISNTACYHDFKCKFGDTVIEGKVKKKEEAKQEYDRHNEEGNLVAYAEIADQNYSVLCVRIGNMPPDTEIEIIFSYIERLEITMNKFWRFTLYSCLVSRATHGASGPLDVSGTTGTASTASDSYRNNVLANYPMYSNERVNNRPGHGLMKEPQWEVNVEIQSRSYINFIKSPSHQVEIQQYDMSNIFTAKVNLAKRYTPNKDFVLLYATDAMNKPSYLLSPFEGGYCTLINFFPEIGYMTFDDAYKASLDGKDPFEHMSANAKNEFIFVVDRSRIMKGARIELVKDALSYFIKAIPSGSYFNILGMRGKENFSLFASQSVPIDDDQIQEALAHVKGFTSNDGEPSIKKIIEYIEKADTIRTHSRIVFLLTSGKMNISTTEVTEMIKDKLFKTRVFTLGIGEGSATEFTKTTAFEGYGHYDIIRTQEEIPEKVSHFIKAATVPYFTDFELRIQNESLFSYVVPLPKVIGCISPNELVEFFIVFNKKLEVAKKTTFTLRFFNGFNQRFEEYKQDIDVECADLSEAVVKLGMLKFCESLLKKKELYEAMGKGEIVTSFKEDVQRNLVNTAVRYGILTPQTSFVCLIKEGDDVMRQIPAQRITMIAPTIETQQITALDESPGRTRLSLDDVAPVAIRTSPKRPLGRKDVLETSPEIPNEEGRKNLNEGFQLKPLQPVGRKLSQREDEPQINRVRPDNEHFNKVEIQQHQLDDFNPNKQAGSPTTPRKRDSERLRKIQTLKEPTYAPTLTETPGKTPDQIQGQTQGQTPGMYISVGNQPLNLNQINLQNVMLQNYGQRQRFDSSGHIQGTTPGMLQGSQQNQSQKNIPFHPTMLSMMASQKESQASLKPFGTMITNANVQPVNQMLTEIGIQNNNVPSVRSSINYPNIPRSSVVSAEEPTSTKPKGRGFLGLFSCTSKKKTSRYTLQDKENLLSQLAHMQTIEGYWLPEAQVLKIVDYKWSKLKNKAPFEVRKQMNADLVWLTALILAWIEHLYPNSPEWEETYNKAWSWLENTEAYHENHSVLEHAKIALGY